MITPSNLGFDNIFGAHFLDLNFFLDFIKKIWTNFLDLGFMGTVKYASFKSILQENPRAEEDF